MPISHVAILTPRKLRRPVELCLGMGIPLIGFFRVADGPERWAMLWLLVPAMLLAGWHVLRINDLLFARPPPPLEQLLMMRNLVPVGVCPLLAAALLSRHEGAALVLVLVMLNWDLYARWGKRHWASGSLHNFLGGGLHFLLGAMAAGATEFAALLPPTMFFALTMTGAACHHDAMHAAEDQARGYRTGAVVFGETRWWRLGLVPLSVAQVALVFLPGSFRWLFAAAFLAYLALYLVFRHRPLPESGTAFRTLCRIAYATIGIAYVVIQMANSR